MQNYEFRKGLGPQGSRKGESRYSVQHTLKTETHKKMFPQINLFCRKSYFNPNIILYFSEISPFICTPRRGRPVGSRPFPMQLQHPIQQNGCNFYTSDSILKSYFQNVLNLCKLIYFMTCGCIGPFVLDGAMKPGQGKELPTQLMI